ncbi:putative Xre family DNA-binding protein [Gordonia namibiensis NBRC 108229]|uniref:Putative Xre family DNA-binding protein n=1 Tax=Gordonia namibiensis NBRC 108229 TaxID=1208314 RepID=K6X4T1_9ACTN|nr:cupin domain-containing protein [Gordonia namibiensis]GAC01097.1 putative Xre family DNA-binding protein [Gordonia namibiensis NBRC 108229]
MSDSTVITGLADNTGKAGDRPDISVLARNDGGNVIRLSFLAGQTMPDHCAGRPILVIGQTGEIDFTVEESTTRLETGVAIHVNANIPHALVARTDAVVTLVVLENPTGEQPSGS